MPDGCLEAGFVEVEALLAAGGEVSSDASEAFGPVEGTEATRDFLFHLDHADVLLGLVVGEGNIGVHKEGQHTEVVVFKSVEHVGGLVLFGAALAGFAPGMGLSPFGNDAPVVSMGVMEDFFIQPIYGAWIV